ncbi:MULTISPECIES: hypothetical protein [unclassified Sphingomonas]|uniref:hypothetical protein n=1 Tax=unclassified Sphingomonas TaxID=196159 RepID=UPI0035A99392
MNIALIPGINTSARAIFPEFCPATKSDGDPQLPQLHLPTIRNFAMIAHARYRPIP